MSAFFVKIAFGLPPPALRAALLFHPADNPMALLITEVFSHAPDPLLAILS
jgi:hypothetical protein